MVAIELISTHVRRELTHRAREFRCKITGEIGRNPSTLNPSQVTVEQLPNLHVVSQTPQLQVLCCVAHNRFDAEAQQGIYTTLRDRTTQRRDFIFNVDRLATYLIERALELVPTGRKTVTTPVGVDYDGHSITPVGIPSVACLSILSEAQQEVCGVTVLRS